MKTLSLNPVGLLLAIERRAAQLADIYALSGKNGDLLAAIQTEKRARRIFWKDERDITNQAKKWQGRKLDRLIGKLVEMHRAILQNSQAAELLLSQGLAEIARAAAARRR